MSERSIPLAGRLWRAYLPLVLVWALYHALALTVLDRVTTPINYDILKFLPGFLPALPFFGIGVVFFMYFRLFVFHGGRPARDRLRGWITQTPWLEVLALRFLPGMFYVFLIQRVYISLKAAIPSIVPFSWDLTFAAWDRALLFGYDAWEITHGLLPSPYAAQVVDELYMLWIYVLFAGVFVAALQPLGDRRRMAYFLATGLSWAVAGSLMAIVFSSAGPVYVERLFGDPTYAGLTDRLAQIDRTHPVAALVTIEKLWQGYTGAAGVTVMGISAFPSMHLCMAALNTVYAFRFGRAWGWAMALFTAAMLVGSVHLGWHYLVDGLAGIPLALVFWAISWRLAGAWERATQRRSVAQGDPVTVLTSSARTGKG